MSRAIRLWAGVLAVFVFGATASAEPASYRAGAKRFTSEMVRRHGFEQREVEAILGQALYRQEIIDAIRRPYEAKPWYKYRPIFLTEKRIRGGVQFWAENAELLERARAKYGVPPQIVAAIMGVETNYGENLGKHRVIDALSTLGFSYPKRADFFRKELEQFLLLSRDESVDSLNVKGSYAGAVGKAQFIPSSYRAYAVDFDGDGRRDLWESNADAIGSVGNYFKRHGWQAGDPVAFEAQFAGRLPRGLPVAGKKPKKPGIRFAKLQAAGMTTEGRLSPSTSTTLIRLDGPRPEYWLGLENFYVITRYNHSNLYAMAVFQLSREIEGLYLSKGSEAAGSGSSDRLFGELE